MADRTRSCCTREYVGVVYHCGDSGFWERCKHYKEAENWGGCKWHSCAKYSSCTCKEAREEADKLKQEDEYDD